MDEGLRLRRREGARRRVRRKRRVVAAGVASVFVAAFAAGGLLVAAGSDDERPQRKPSERREPPPELPRGGRRILPDNRVVAFYGAPQDAELGVLGIGRPRQVARHLERRARPYIRPGRSVLPAFELIATIVTSEAGERGDHAMRQPRSTIRRYLRTARAHDMLLLLDIQPGYAPFLREARALERFLKEPEVSLALDPEWSMDPPELPGHQIGSTDAATVNAVSRYLSRIVRRYDLPQKLLVVHRFTEDMIESEHQLKRHPGVALVMNIDGFGDQPTKISKYRQLTRHRSRRFNGFKLFYNEDTDLLRPKQVLRLRPQPNVVIYE